MASKGGWSKKKGQKKRKRLDEDDVFLSPKLLSADKDEEGSFIDCDTEDEGSADDSRIGRRGLEDLPLEVVRGMMEKNLGWREAESLSRVSSRLRKAWIRAKNDVKTPKGWNAFRPPLEEMHDWSEEKVLECEVKGRRVEECVWMGCHVQASSDFSGTLQDKWEAIAVLLLLSPKPDPETEEEKQYVLLTLESKEAEGPWKRGEGGLCSCMSLFQDHIGWDARDFCKGGRIKDIVKLVKKQGTHKGPARKPKMNIVNRQMNRRNLVTEVVRVRFERGSLPLRSAKEDVRQSLAFVKGETHVIRIGVNLELVGTGLLSEDEMISQFKKTKAQELTKEDWIQVQDPRRLLCLPMGCKNPSVAKNNGTRNPGRKLQPIPGLNFILYNTPKIFADFIYDQNFVGRLREKRERGGGGMLLIPFKAVPIRGKNSSKNEDSTSTESPSKKAKNENGKVREKRSYSSFPLEPTKGRWTTLLVEGKMERGLERGKERRALSGIPLPCGIRREVSPRDYGGLLRDLGGGWVNYPEKWWRTMESFLKSEHFQKGKAFPTLQPDQKRRMMISGLLRTDIPLTHLKLVPRIKKKIGEWKIRNSQMETNLSSNQCLSYTFFEKAGGIKGLLDDLIRAVDTIEMEKKNAKIHSANGVVFFSLRFEMNTVQGLENPDPEEKKVLSPTAHFLQEMGKQGRLTGRLNPSPEVRKELEEKEREEEKLRAERREIEPKFRKRLIREQREAAKEAAVKAGERKFKWGNTMLELTLKEKGDDSQQIARKLQNLLALFEKACENNE